MSNHRQITTAVLAAAMLATIVGGSTGLLPAAMAQMQQADFINAIAGGFESISVVQDDTQIVITITKTGGEPLPPGTEENQTTVPTDPIIIIPPNNETGQNGTVIVPAPPGNDTSTGGNDTATEPPVIIIDGDNSTTVEPPSNVTQVDNGTVIVHPPDQNVTITDGNVTVVDPPVTGDGDGGNQTVDCGCPLPEGPGVVVPPADNGTAVVPPAGNDTGTNVTEPFPVPPVEEEPTLPIDDTSQQPVNGEGNGNGGDGEGNGGEGEQGN